MLKAAVSSEILMITKDLVLVGQVPKLPEIVACRVA